MVDTPQRWDLPELDNYVEDTLRRMANNRDVRSNQAGEPIYRVKAAGGRADGTLRIDLLADLSGIGMPTDAPLTVIAGLGSRLAWFLGDVLIASTPDSHTPEQAGNALGMDQLLAAHRRWAGRSGESISK
jgi:hypothetical protein